MTTPPPACQAPACQDTVLFAEVSRAGLTTAHIAHSCPTGETATFQEPLPLELSPCAAPQPTAARHAFPTTSVTPPGTPALRHDRSAADASRAFAALRLRLRAVELTPRLLGQALRVFPRPQGEHWREINPGSTVGVATYLACARACGVLIEHTPRVLIHLSTNGAASTDCGVTLTELAARGERCQPRASCASWQLTPRGVRRFADAHPDHPDTRLCRACQITVRRPGRSR